MITSDTLLTLFSEFQDTYLDKKTRLGAYSSLFTLCQQIQNVDYDHSTNSNDSGRIINEQMEAVLNQGSEFINEYKSLNYFQKLKKFKLQVLSRKHLNQLKTKFDDINLG